MEESEYFTMEDGLAYMEEVRFAMADQPFVYSKVVDLVDQLGRTSWVG